MLPQPIETFEQDTQRGPFAKSVNQRVGHLPLVALPEPAYTLSENPPNFSSTGTDHPQPPDVN